MNKILIPEDELGAFIIPYILTTNEKRPAIIICPGGGYSRVSDREAEPIALQFMAKGYHAFVLTYSVAPYRYPAQLIQLAATMKLVRDHADEWNIDGNKIAVIGFSAGGHLAGSLAVHWDKEVIAEKLQLSNEYVKPNAVLLSYPVITSGACAHRGSFDNLVGQDEGLLELLSLEKQVSDQVPPVFLWHTLDDASVPVENSMLFAMSLRQHSIPFEMHIYDKGVHGLSLCNYMTSNGGDPKLIDEHVATWLPLACEWLERQYAIEE